MQKEINEDYVSLFIEKCKENNLKVTPQRISIFKQLIKMKNHPTVDEIFKKVRKDFPTISFDTVYRTLLTFTNIGIVNVVESYNGLKRFDPNLDTHHHLHCIECGKIVDFKDANFDQIDLPSELKEDFTVLNKRVIFSGVCNKCINK